jgi:uncharacterized protein
MTCGPIPASAGIGLRGPHVPEFLHGSPPVGWLEVHSENYFAGCGPAHEALLSIRSNYPLSMHGVGLSLGSADPLDREHLRKLDAAVRRYEPALVSEHLSWSSIDGVHVNDLLPVPLTVEAFEHIRQRVDVVQEFLGRQILIENVSSYIEYCDSQMPEHVFMNELARRTGCGILLDVNNLFVNEHNHGHSAREYIDEIRAESVVEMHLAGHSVQVYGGCELLVDTHDARVRPEVWDLYAHAIARVGCVPTLIEWDSRLPPFADLLAEAAVADSILEKRNALAA